MRKTSNNLSVISITAANYNHVLDYLPDTICCRIKNFVAICTNVFRELHKHGIVVGSVITGNMPNLMGYANSRNDFEQCLAKASPVVSIVQLREAEKRSMNLPLPGTFLYP